MSNIFKKQFLGLLTEDIDLDDEEEKNDDVDDLDLSSDDPSPEQEEKAFVNSLDDDTDPDEYDVNPNSFKAINHENIEEAKKWIKILEDFADLINSVDNDTSLNHFLNRVDREGSAFRGVVRSQGKRVTRIAEEASDRKERELLQQFPNLKK